VSERRRHVLAVPIGLTNAPFGMIKIVPVQPFFDVSPCLVQAESSETDTFAEYPAVSRVPLYSHYPLVAEVVTAAGAEIGCKPASSVVENSQNTASPPLK